ncbi:MAG TPA: NYN domain-containing protein [Candidatus Dormibacteraeota bacterium]|nr:NYN domain-containing protein [Candidatus Dormibacteraeota bacterium]
MNKNAKPNYAFIDSQNLNLGIKSQGWTLDFRKFRLYLRNKYNVQKAYLFIGQMAGQEFLYDRLQSMGYHLIFKPTTEYKVKGKVMVKGNVDAELVLYAAAKVFDEYDKAIIVSGDGDFHCLAEYLLEKGKLGYILVPNKKFSSLLRRFDMYVKRVDNAKRSLQLVQNKKARTSGRYETLGIPGHGDTPNIARQRPKVNKRGRNKGRK